MFPKTMGNKAFTNSAKILPADAPENLKSFEDSLRSKTFDAIKGGPPPVPMG